MDEDKFCMPGEKSSALSPGMTIDIFSCGQKRG